MSTTKIITSRDVLKLAVVAVCLMLATIRSPSPDLTLIEVALAGSFGITIFVNIIAWLNESDQYTINLTHITAPLIIFAGIVVTNIAIATIQGTPALIWFREAFPLMAFLGMIFVGYSTTRTRAIGYSIYNLLLLLSLSVVVVSTLSAIIASLDTSNIYVIRKLRSGFHSAFLLSLISGYIITLTQGFRRRITIVILLIGGVSLLLTFTRTLYVSATFGLGIVVLMSPQLRLNSFSSNLLSISMLSGGAFLILMMTGLESLIIERIMSFDEALKSNSVQERLLEIRGITGGLLANPLGLLTGNGLGTEYTFYSVDPGRGDGWLFSTSFSHNYFAYLLWTMGLPGFISFCMGYGLFTLRLIRENVIHEKPDPVIPGTLAAILCLLVALLTAPPLINITWAIYFGVLIGTVLGIINESNGT